MIPFDDPKDGLPLKPEMQLSPTEGRRARLVALTVAYVVAIVLTALATVGPGDAVIAGASSPTYQSYCHSTPERHAWCRWRSWMADGRNRAWFAIEQHFGSGRLGDEAKRVADCESNFEPRALNRSSGASGVFQVIGRYHADRFEQVTGQPFYDGRFDPDANARYARDLYNRKGWQPWVCKP